MAYTTPPQMSAPQRPPRREVDFSVISEGFNMLFANWQTYIIPGSLMFIAVLPSVIVGLIPLLNGRAFETGLGIQWGVLGLQLLLQIAGGLFTALLYPGIVQFTLNLARGKPAQSSDLWIGFKDPLGYLAAVILAGLVAFLGVFACLIGAYVTSALMMFVLPIKVDTGKRATECVAESWEMLKSEWLMAGVFFFVVGIISGLGALACYIGMVVTIPFRFIGPTLLYSRYVGFTPPMTQTPYSPYPRGQGYGETIGSQQPPREETTPPPRPEDLG